MLFCDGCDLATYHMACLLPPIETVPEDDWLCPVCEQVIYIHTQKLFICSQLYLHCLKGSLTSFMIFDQTIINQVLLFLKLRINLDKLKIFTLVPHASRSRARKSHPLPRYLTKK